MSRKKKRSSASTSTLTAANADRHLLYQASVQFPEADISFAKRVYQRLNGSAPSILREDFCGTAHLACEWAADDDSHEAWGVDLDAATLDWGREHCLKPVGDAAERVHLLKANVLEADVPPADVCFALNFSYSCFFSRDELVAYFRTVHERLADGGIFIMDAFGGTDAMEVMEEESEKECLGEDFTYVWDQDEFCPVSHRMKAYIHFRFEDGTEVPRAFTYDWRFWTVPELKDCLASAGFEAAQVYLEGYDKEGEGNGVFTKVERAEPCEGFIAYVVARRRK